ncbi:MAG TPA: STM3941 family protein [Candidatus Angelobacter sp.]|nr:STM3941 family protein [Candidatus Angelobacter sp.]
MPVIWKRWLQLLFALLFVALGGWMLLDALAAPAGAKTAQIWSALAIVVMFAGCAAIFAYELVGSRRADGRARGAAGHGAAPAAGPLVAVYSNLWTTLGLAGCVSFAAAGVMMLLASIAGGSDGIGWPGFIVGPLTAIVFGGFAVIGAAQLRRRGWAFRHIRIDAAGLYDSRIGQTIEWGDILSITCRTLYGQRMIEFDLADPERHLARLDRTQGALARLNRAVGFAPYAITLTGLSVGEAEIITAIERFRSRQDR